MSWQHRRGLLRAGGAGAQPRGAKIWGGPGDTRTKQWHTGAGGAGQREEWPGEGGGGLVVVHGCCRTTERRKTTTLTVNVNLDCPRCYRQIRKVLCKLQADQERIRTISYDDNSHTVSITGSFDPLQLCCKIRCLGGKVIRDIQIKQSLPPPPPPPPPCTCKRDIEQLKLVMADIQRQQNICVDQNRDIDQLKQQMEDLQGRQQSCVEMKREIKQVESNIAELREQLHRLQSFNKTVQIRSPTSCSGGYSPLYCSGQYEGCRRERVHSYAAARLAGCHGGPPYCGCYKGCQMSEEDASTACSVM